MKTLIVEDDFTSRLLLQEILKSYGPSHVAVTGQEAVQAVRMAYEANEPYDLICLDVMMPVMDGQEALKQIRAFEEQQGVNPARYAKVVMTTALGDYRNRSDAYYSLCDAYIVKPIGKAALLDELRKLALIA